MDLEKVNNIIKFAIAAAGREDFESRELGPIHLVKYVYIADLAYSQSHHGDTYTNVEWKFHHFGPWSSKVFLQIEPTIESIGATERKISSPKYEDDFYRWSIDDEELYESLFDALPFEISAAIKNAVHTHGNDTAGLLDYVYKTRPMLQAAPGEVLCFELSEKEADLPEDYHLESESQRSALTVKEKRQRKAAIEELKERLNTRLQDKLAVRRKKRKYSPPRYDAVYFEGIKWLDSLTGEPINPGEGVLKVSEGVWKSPFRTKDEIP